MAHKSLYKLTLEIILKITQNAKKVKSTKNINTKISTKT